MNVELARQMTLAGCMPFVLEHHDADHGWRGFMALPVILKLERDPRFACGLLYGCHREVGDHLKDFRSFNGELGQGSLQIVVDEQTGAFWADIDRHNPYNDVVRFLGHAYDVTRDWVRRWWG